MTPAQTATTVREAGVAKADARRGPTFVLAVLAGAFIALGAAFATTVAAGAADALPYGVTRLLVGVVFSVGLILVVVAGARLFTGDTLMAAALADRRITAREMVAGWALVYVGNAVGALGTVALMWAGKVYTFGDGTVGATAVKIAETKTGLGFTQAIALGMLCNALVCLAVWMATSAETVGGKVAAIVFPIAAFVAMGFEHSIANMFFLPFGWVAGAHLTFGQVIGANLLPVTIGNIIGGAVMVGLMYWYAYLREA